MVTTLSSGLPMERNLCALMEEREIEGERDRGRERERRKWK